MRIWIGKEQEGIEVGIETIFVESTSITKDLFPIIFKAIDTHNVKRLYIGAGRVDCIYIEKVHELVNECKKRGVEIIQETSVHALDYVNIFIAEYGEVIITIRNQNLNILPPNVSFKIDNYRVATLYQNTLTNIRELDDVQDNMYACDTIIFETNR